MKKLAIITTHPIQYNAPLFALLAKRGVIDVKVFYTWGEKVLKQKYDPGFGKTVEWDIPLLEGYTFEFVENTSKNPGSHHYKGIENPALISKINEWRADAILVYGWKFKSHWSCMRYYKGRIPVFFRGDSINNEFMRFNLKFTLRRMLLTFIYNKVDRAFYVGKKNREYFLHNGVLSNRLVFMPHAVDNDRFASATKTSSNYYRDELGIPIDVPVFLYAGKIDANKNVKLILDAFILLNNPNTWLIVAGEGSEKKRLEEMYGNISNILFLPFHNQSEMPKLYSCADIFVLASFSETWGLGVNEAMATGLGVLVSKKAGCSEDLVETGYNGFHFDPLNETELAERMKLVIANPNHYKRNSSFKIKEWSFSKGCDVLEGTLQTLTK